MSGGKRDSSKTRVAPVFDILRERSDDWVRQLLSLAECSGTAKEIPGELDLTCLDGKWGTEEQPFPPPQSLLRWMVSNPSKLVHSSSDNADRNALLQGDEAALRSALAAIETQPTGRGWHLLEGTTFPDATIVTRDAIVVVEGKRTESGPTLDTSWLAGRQQIWRHIEGAWEAREGRRVFGMFIVEGNGGSIPAVWSAAATQALEQSSLATSFPHRSQADIQELAGCFLGVSTWQRVCSHFGIDFAALPDTTDDLLA